MEQRRHFSRVLFKAKATLSGDAQAHPCEVLDLSLKGALVRVSASEHWRPEMVCVLALELDTEQEAVIRMDCQVAHREGTVIGLHCVEIDLDSITHLRRLLELNVGDETVLQRELSALSAE
jgi:PilZ domain